MNFISMVYFMFLVGSFVLYWHLPEKIRNIFLLTISCIFYAYWDFRYLTIITASVTISYYIGNRIFYARQDLKKKQWLLICLFINIGLLGYFKYADFFIENLNNLAGLDGMRLVEPLKLILPIGISFYIFQSITYPIAIYWKRIPTSASLIDFAAYVTFFPKMIAGPIERAEDFLVQLKHKKKFSGEDLQEGCTRIITGFFKKAVIADTLAEQLVSPVFSNPGAYSRTTLWIAMIGYAIQIYSDFSGYSNIAIGSARLFGFKLTENFQFPYLSRNVSDFWRRWHITMSMYFRDYVYIPLGGNRRRQVRVNANLMMTMLLCGLWHGAAWNFVIWGGIHGIFLIVTNYARQVDIKSMIGERAQILSSWLITQILVCIAWVFFRSDTFDSSIKFIHGLLATNGDQTISLSWFCYACIGFFLFDHLYGWAAEYRNTMVQRTPESLKALIYTAIIILSFYLMPAHKSQFIYFNF